MTFNALPQFYLTWNASTEPLDSFLRYQVYRRRFGETVWVKKARITDRSITFFDDPNVESGVLYEYDVTQVKTVSGEEVESAFSASPVQGTIVIVSLFVHSKRDPGLYAEVRLAQQQLTRMQDIEFRKPYSRRTPTAFVGIGLERNLSISHRDIWSDNSELWNALVALQDAQSPESFGDVLVARQGRKIFMYCQIDGVLSRDDTILTFESGLRFKEVFVREEVD